MAGMASCIPEIFGCHLSAKKELPHKGPDLCQFLFKLKEPILLWLIMA